jgi:uncharacterized protein YjbI with pentapeptide repeats
MAEKEIAGSSARARRAFASKRSHTNPSLSAASLEKATPTEPEVTSRTGFQSTTQAQGNAGLSDRSARSLTQPTKTLGDFFAGLWCRRRWPRRWWYPLHDQTLPAPADEATQKRYEGCVETVRGTMLAILSFCLFSFVTVVGTPDSALIASEAKIKLPFADTEIVFIGFLVGAVFLLVVLTIYLHIFDTERRELESSYNISPVSALFTLNRPLAKALCKFTFFWLVPIVLAAITWKALARLWWGLPLLAVTIVMTWALIWMQIRRCPSAGRFRNNLPRWVVLIGLAAVCGLATRYPDAFHRPLSLFRVDLAGRWLADADLRGADLNFASLVKAQLGGAKLQGAYLGYAKLQGASLQGAQLQGAGLIGAQLQGARLSGAQLQDAELSGAQLQDADLSGAQLQGADLEEAQLQGAHLHDANFQGAELGGAQLQRADLEGAQLQGANLEEAQLQGAELRGAQLQGTDLTATNVWLANFPPDLANQTPAPWGLAAMKMSSPTPDDKVPPNWKDQDRWKEYVSKAKGPSADELVQFHVALACDDSEGYIAYNMVVRVHRFKKVVGYAKAFARALLDENCKGGKALSDEMRAKLEELVSEAE